MNVKLFFETFLENANTMSSEEFEYYSHKIKFVFELCDITITSVQSKNTNIGFQVPTNMYNKMSWKLEYERFKSCGTLHYISSYFGLNTFTNQIFKLIKFAILDDSYFVTKECFNNPFDYENHKDMIYVSSGIDSLRHRIKDNICNYSLTNLSIKLCKLFANNYSKYVTEKHIYSNLSQELNNALTKHNMNYGNIQFCKMAPTKEILQERTYLYWFSCLNITNENNYACYCDVYNVMKKYCDLMENDIESHNSMTDNTNIQVKQSKNEVNDKNNKKVLKNKKTPIPKKIKQLVWNKYIGEEHGIALCKCCDVTVISQMDFVCGHIISEYNGGTVTIDNLKPICSLCNSSMGTKNINEFITMHGLNGNLSDDAGVERWNDFSGNNTKNK